MDANGKGTRSILNLMTVGTGLVACIDGFEIAVGGDFALEIANRAGRRSGLSGDGNSRGS